jgi:hypothetical protein
MIARWIWWAALAALAPVVVFAQLDRASAGNPGLAGAVPGPFLSVAQAPVALAALSAAPPAVARTEARRLVRRRPMPAEHLFALALADLRAGNPQPFAAGFRAASVRGWRYLPLQLAAAQAAIANGDADGGAQRIAASWVGGADDAAIGPVVKAQFALPRGPEAFGRVMARSRVSPGELVARLLSMMTAQDVQRVVAAAQAAGATLDCPTRDILSSRLDSEGIPMGEEALRCR